MGAGFFIFTSYLIGFISCQEIILVVSLFQFAFWQHNFYFSAKFICKQNFIQRTGSGRLVLVDNSGIYHVIQIEFIFSFNAFIDIDSTKL